MEHVVMVRKLLILVTVASVKTMSYFFKLERNEAKTTNIYCNRVAIESIKAEIKHNVMQDILSNCI